MTEGSADGLVAGAARSNLDIEPGMPGPGLRMWGEPFNGQETPLSVGAFVATSGGRTAVIIATDLLWFPDATARRIREQAAHLAGTSPELVLLNASHAHSTPPIPGMPFSGDVGAIDRFGATVERTIASVVQAAVVRRRPARIGTGTGSSSLGVYRRAHGADGRDHLGEVPDAPIDPTVGVIRVDALDGSAIAILFSFGCHPVLHGPWAYRISSDYPGAARAAVERNIGGVALFLQACGDDVNPRFGIGLEQDPVETKDRDGMVLGAEVLRVASEVRTAHRRGPETSIASFGVSYWPWEPVTSHQAPVIAGADRVLDVPLSDLPTLDAAMAINAIRHRELETLEVAEAAWVDRHIARSFADWSDVLVAAVEHHVRTVPVTVQALRIGDVAFAAVAMETFSCTGIDVKARSPFPNTVLLGYSNGYHSYLPRAQDLPPGGWKPTERYAVPDLYPAAWLQPTAIGSAAEQQVVETCVSLLERVR